MAIAPPPPSTQSPLPPSTPAPPARGGAIAAVGRALRRLRWAMALAFAVLTLAVLAHAYQVFRLDPSREQLLGAVATLLGLLLLGLAVVGPSLRALRSATGQLQERVGKWQRLAQVAERTTALVCLTDRDDRVTWCNEAFTRVSGWPLGEAAGRRLGELLDSAHADAKVLARVQRAVQQGRGERHEWLHRARDGRDLWLDVDLCPLHGEDGQLAGFVRVCIDVTVRVQGQASGPPRADVPAPLPRRAVVVDRLERAIDHARRHPGYGFAVLLVDIDRCAQADEALGHGAGDDLLRQVAERLQLALRPGDAWARLEDNAGAVARAGGDAFLVVLEGEHDAGTVGVIADRLLEELTEPYLLRSTPVPWGASLGAVLCTGGDNATATPATTATTASTVDMILRHADTAMHEARRAGRGRWVLFDDSMQERATRTQEVAADLRRGLDEDQLIVVYQPEMDLATRLPVGVEALVRWRHPVRGLVPPAEFIGIAEEAGLVDAIGSQVMRTACLQFMRWRHGLGARAPHYLAVNLSRVQLQRGDFVNEVRALLQETGLEPAQLQLEFTETAAALDEPAQGTLRTLKALGVKLALDDFGTGISSLACLHRMPVDTVKIDRSFVRQVETVESHHVLIEATIRVARALGMSTVAEGIETQGQAALMLRLECDRGQGSLYSRPLEAAEFETWLRRETAAMAQG